MTKSVAQDRIGFAFIFNLESYKLQKYFSFVKYAATDFHNIPFCIMHRETLNDALQNVHLRAVRVFSALNHFPQFENIGSCCRCGKKEMCRQQKVKGAATGVDNPRLGLQMSSPIMVVDQFQISIGFKFSFSNILSCFCKLHCWW